MTVAATRLKKSTSHRYRSAQTASRDHENVHGSIPPTTIDALDFKSGVLNGDSNRKTIREETTMLYIWFIFCRIENSLENS
jgi:succinylglutamate desuccinylase